MAPPSQQANDFSDRPLADFFWIAGLDTQELLDAFKTTSFEQTPSFRPLNSPGHKNVDEIIREDVAEQQASSIVSTPGHSNRHSRQDPYQRLSRLSADARSSIQSIDRLGALPNTRNNTTTIRRVTSLEQQTSGTESPDRLSPTFFATSNRTSNHLEGPPDFEDMLEKFAHDRDAFYLDLHFRSSEPESDAAKVIPKRTRTQRIIAEDIDATATPTRGLTVRRHMSFKDTNSTKRQLSMTRKLSTKGPRRVSGYNSVMSMPQPIQSSADEHPLKRSFAPSLLDRYPRPAMAELLHNRNTFPDFVPMFAFPNDVRIISADSRPSTTWHEFSMTGGDNSRTPAVCVVVWVSLQAKIADALERKCEEWRRAHMSEAERELAASLAERLATEREKLSRLLAMLPNAEFGAKVRNELEDEISTVEEKISLMSEMLRPLRHAAASRIEGLTDGGTGFWVPRAYGILGRDQFMVPFWKEWLKAVILPMMDGAIIGVPPTSPRVGMWQPLEHYVSTICNDARIPMNAKVQVQVGIRELRLFAKKEAKNELPGSRSIDLYPLFRSLTIPNIVMLFEYVFAEARIILVSSHTSLLKAVSNALLTLMWPLEWSGVYIPVLPARLMQVLEAPMPYICGVVRVSSTLPTPEDDDFVLVDLDQNEIHATAHPPAIPRQQRRKLMSLLYLASPLHQTCGVSPGPPAYIRDTYPNNMFMSESSALYSSYVASTDLAKLASLTSTQFGENAVSDDTKHAPLLNAFQAAQSSIALTSERPQTGKVTRHSSQAGSDQMSPVNSTCQQLPTTPHSRNDSGYAIQTSLREKRSGYFDSLSKKREPSVSNMRRKASLPFVRHAANLSQLSNVPTSNDSNGAPSVYAQSTLAASTIMPGTSYQAVQNTSTTAWIEGHHMQWQKSGLRVLCTVCNDVCEDSHYRCAGCPLGAHARCLNSICLPCNAAFHPNQVRAAFARFFASLFQNHRRFLRPADAHQKKSGLVMKLDVDAWIKALPTDHGDYIRVLRETQAFDMFVNERETRKTPSESMALFDAVIAARKSRSRGVRSSIAISLSGRNPFAGRAPAIGVPAEYLSDTSDHVWRVVSIPRSSDKADLGNGAKDREYSKIISRAPARLEDELFPSPFPSSRHQSSVSSKHSLRRRMNGLSMHAP